MLKKLCGVLLAFALSAGLAVSVKGDSLPYRAYTYDEWGNAVAAPGGYEPTDAVDGVRLGVGPLAAPKDMYYAEKTGKFYILDSGNNRVVIADRELKNAKTLQTFRHADGFEEELDNPEGIFVTPDGTLYIADKNNYRIVVCDENGLVSKVLVQPRSDLFPADKAFAPTSLVVDSIGTVYATCEGIYNGAVMLDPDNRFLGYFGSNEVKLTASLLIDRFWKSLLSSKARSQLANYIPVEMTSLEIGRDDFVYTCTLETDDVTASVRKINPFGSNILKSKAQSSFQGGFGDLQPFTYDNQTYTTRFIDLCVDENQAIFALDYTSGRVFQYDEEGNLLFVFGGIGNQKGLFYQPVAVESVGSTVYVLDAVNNNITSFKPTLFGTTLLHAIDLYQQGEYQESAVVWRQVLKLNSNYTMAHVGVGKAALEQGDYRTAMRSFKLGNDKGGYNDAYKEARAIALRRWFPLIAALAAFAVLGLYRRRLPWLGKRLAARAAGRGERPMQAAFRRFSAPARIAFHPIEGFSDLFYKKERSLPVTLALAALFFLLTIVRYQYQGFLFTDYNKEEINILFMLVQTVVLLVLFTAVNWAFTTLFDGKGKAGDIWTAVTYSLFPLLVCQAIGLLLSNFLLQEEGMFLSILAFIGYAWTGLLLLKGLEACHQYSMKMTVASVAASAIGLFIIAFVFVLLLSLSQQMISFITTVVQEISLR